MERLAFELMNDLIRIAEHGHKQGANKGLHDKETYRVLIRLSDDVKATSRSFIDLFRAVGSSILDERRHDEIKLAAVGLTMLLKSENPRVKEVENALTALTDVLHVEEEDRGEEENYANG